MKTHYTVKVQIITWLITLIVVGLSASEMVPKLNSTKLNLGCGGNISVRGRGPENPLILSYTSSGGKKNGEKCLWTFDTTSKNSQRYNFMATISLLDSIPADAHLYVLELKSTSNNKDLILSPHELKQNKEIYRSKGWNHNLYLSYTSSGKKSASGRYEFSLVFSVLKTQKQDSGSNECVTAKPGNSGTYNYSVAGARNMFSMIVNMEKPSIKLTINSFSPNRNTSQCSRNDSLDIYEIGKNLKPKRHDRLCKKLNHPQSYTSQYPFLVTFFASARGNVGSKFQILWE